MAKKLTRQALIELPADEVTLNRLADEIMKKTSAQGYLTVSNALQDTAQEYGDFQTPLPLAKFACQRLVQMGYRPKILIEPTCGEGNFIIAALEAFPSIRKVFGLEIQEGCVAKCKARLLATLLPPGRYQTRNSHQAREHLHRTIDAGCSQNKRGRHSGSW